MLSEQLQNDIKAEAKSSAADFCYHPGSSENEDFESAYVTGANKYASKWQEEKELRERYEKALREIRTNAVFPKTENEAGVAIYNILKLCNEALTPKIGSDE